MKSYTIYGHLTDGELLQIVENNPDATDLEVELATRFGLVMEELERLVEKYDGDNA